MIGNSPEFFEKESVVSGVLTCREAENMVMPYIEGRLSVEELEQFLKHIQTCKSCREELEIYYTVSLGLRQLSEEADDYDIAGALQESLNASWLQVRAARLRHIAGYAADTLGAVGVLTVFVMQLRIWLTGGF